MRMHSGHWNPGPAAFANLEVEEASIRSAWLRSLAASNAVGHTSDGTQVRFAADGTPEIMGPRLDVDASFEAITSAFGARLRVIADSRPGLRGRARLQLQSVAHRWCDRLPAPNGSRIVNASVPGLVGATVEDLSPTALGAVPTAPIHESHVEFEAEIGGRRAVGAATLVPHAGRCGLCVHQGPARELVQSTYVSFRFPELVSRADIDHREAIELARKSGFLELRPGMDVPPGWADLRLPAHLGQDAAYKDAQGRAVGFMSATRTGRRAWLVHQLVSDRHHPEIYGAIFQLHDFMMTYPRVMGGTDARIMCYFDRGKSRNEIYYDSFERMVGDPELVGTVPLQRFERPDGTPLPAEIPASARAELRECKEEDELALFELVRRNLPRLHADALEAFPGMFTRSSVDPSFDESGLQRGRKTFVLVEPSGIVAAALCEYGSRELSLFGLFNICHLYRRPGAPVHEADERRLLFAVRRFYLEQGISDPVITSPPRCFEVLREPGTRLEETMAWYVWHPDILPQYENFYRFRFGSFPYVRPKN